MTDIIELPVEDWSPACRATLQAEAIQSLERGGVLLFPRLHFGLTPDEIGVMTSGVGGSAKNVSLDPARGMVRGTRTDERDQSILQAMMSRFARFTQTLLAGVLPKYAATLQQARTSFRPAEVSGRPTSWRKDDTRLHVDSFPSSPTQGNRILRVFTNVNPHGKARVWRVGESFEDVARHFLPSLREPVPGSAALLRLLRITKARRSAYDHYMLQLHDGMKADQAYQADSPQFVHGFLPGNSWIVYTDQVSHAAMSGQYALEQTYHLGVDAMQDPQQSPLGVLQRLLGRKLA